MGKKNEPKKAIQVFMCVGTLMLKSGRAIMLWPLDSEDEAISVKVIVDAFDLDPYTSLVGRPDDEARPKTVMLGLTRGKCGDMRPRPGAMYQTTVSGTSVTISGPDVKFLGHHEDFKAVQELDAMDRARRAAYDAKEADAKALKKNHLHEALEPVRAAYQKSVGSQRAQLLAQIVDYITRT